METIFSSSGQYNTNNPNESEYRENDKNVWVRCYQNDYNMHFRQVQIEIFSNYPYDYTLYRMNVVTAANV